MPIPTREERDAAITASETKWSNLLTQDDHLTLMNKVLKQYKRGIMTEWEAITQIGLIVEDSLQGDEPADWGQNARMVYNWMK